MPVIKKESDRVALVEAATSGEACFFLGTDSAPHALGRKLAPVCAAGVFNAPVALETYAEIFANAGRLDRLEAFASLNGPRHYGLPVNEGYGDAGPLRVGGAAMMRRSTVPRSASPPIAAARRCPWRMADAR